MKTSHRIFAGIALLVMTLHVHAFPGESIALDPATGNYTITYVSDPKATQLSQTTFVPATKIAPAIRSSFRIGAQGVIVYRYAVSNGATAKQSIVSVVLEQIANPVLGEIPMPSVFTKITQADLDAYVAAEAAALASPNGWDGSISRRISNIGWSPKNATFMTGGIQPGQALSGFGFRSPDLPGIGPSWMAGLIRLEEIFGFPDEGPVRKSAILAELNQMRDNDFVVRNAAIPSISVPTPFDATILLDRIRTEMNSWPAKQLLDPAYATQLDRYLVSAADAYRLANTKAGKEHIKTIRKMLAKEHHNLDHDDEGDEDTKEHKTATRFTIDRLAARVLDFDLRYVLKRMDADKEEAHH